MATILRSNEREFKEEENKIDPFRLFTDVSREKKGINPKHLIFDLRQLNPGQYWAAYHFHRYAEELFMIISGCATLRTPAGLETVSSGDLIFFEMGETGAHQLYNHMDEPCVYLDIRTFIGVDICEYPDSNKINIMPMDEIFRKDAQVNYFDGEEHVREKWEELKHRDTTIVDEPAAKHPDNPLLRLAETLSDEDYVEIEEALKDTEIVYDSEW